MKKKHARTRLTLLRWRKSHSSCKIDRQEIAFRVKATGKLAKVFLTLTCQKHGEMLIYDEVTPR